MGVQNRMFCVYCVELLWYTYSQQQHDHYHNKYNNDCVENSKKMTLQLPVLQYLVLTTASMRNFE